MKNQRLFIICAALTAIGCFSPWEKAGDLISYTTNGIRLFPRLEDSGGLLILILTGLVVYLFISPHPIIPAPQRIGRVLSGINLAAAVLFIGRWAYHAIQHRGIIGGPTLEFGLILVVIGTVGMLLSARAGNSARKNVTRMDQASSDSVKE